MFINSNCRNYEKSRRKIKKGGPATTLFKTFFDFLLLDIRKLQTIAFFLVFDFQQECENQ